jgi:hypothetical protein
MLSVLKNVRRFIIADGFESLRDAGKNEKSLPNPLINLHLHGKCNASLFFWKLNMSHENSSPYSNPPRQSIDRQKFLMSQFGTAEIQEWLLKDGSREDLISWLVWNDPNGIYTDADSLAEGYSPLSLELARETMQGILQRDE